MRTFDTGATRDNDEDKPDYEGYLSPLVIKRFGQYMTKHRRQADGTLRASDNWQKGIPRPVYIKSLFRHFIDLWEMHRYGPHTPEVLEDALCAILFNTMGYLHETLGASVADDTVEHRAVATVVIGSITCTSCGWVSSPGVGIECDHPVNGPFYCPSCGFQVIYS